MSVYTHLNEGDIVPLLELYDIGRLVDFSGIEGGVENTNYFVDVIKDGITSRYVLTLFEYLPEDALPFFIDFTDELKEAGLPVPNPVRDQQGRALHYVQGKPALIAACFKGNHKKELRVQDCQQIGTILAHIHQAGQKSNLFQENQRGIHWLNEQQQRLQSLLKESDALYMKAQWQSITAALESVQNLPQGLIHGDLFHDNVLFDQNGITGVIDFYNACHDWLIYDLAVTVNDWCLNPDLTLDSKRAKALTSAYDRVRPFTEEEKQVWPAMLRLAAFRFWVSRIITFIHPEEAVDNEHEVSLVRNFKAPDEFREILRDRTNSKINKII